MTYTSLFKVIVAHSYYASSICDCLRYKANADTQKFIDKYGLVMRLTNNGFELYTTTNQSIEDYLNDITQVSETTAFDFFGITTDQNFYNFTNIPINEIGVLTYASDQTTSTTSNETNQLEATFVTETSTQEQKAVTISIKFEDIIRLKKSNDTILFNIQMQARETLWHYYIINNSNQVFNQLTIEGNNDIQFEQSQEVILQNGQKALLFSSEPTKIPLKNEVTYTFNLVSMANEQIKTIVKGLPIPNPNNLQLNKDHKIIASMYVYL